jgi:tripartite-type tricarboxylate transporter receptor subunit TctC
VTSWNGIAAPAGTPRDIIDRLNREIAAVLQLPEMQDRFRQMGMEAASSTPEGMTERLGKDLERWRDVIGKLGLRQ